MKLENKITGDIVFSESPGKKMKEWRSVFDIAQKRLASKMGVSPSVVSDYENGRRKNPGTEMVKKFVEGLIEIDKERGGRIINKFTATSFPEEKGILSMEEFSEPVSVKKFCETIGGKMVVEGIKEGVHGYTIIDAKEAALAMSSWELMKMYGENPKRALIFTNLFSGRASTYGVKMAGVMGFKPSLIVLNLKGKVNFAKKIARNLRIPLAVIKEDLEEILNRLEESF